VGGWAGIDSLEAARRPVMNGTGTLGVLATGWSSRFPGGSVFAGVHDGVCGAARAEGRRQERLFTAGWGGGGGGAWQEARPGGHGVRGQVSEVFIQAERRVSRGERITPVEAQVGAVLRG